MDTTFPDGLRAAVERTWGAEIAAVEPLAGDASSRSYLRLRLRGAGPPSVVVMVLADSALPLSSEELSVFSEPLTELPYVNVDRFLRPLGMRIPDLYYDGQKEGFLLLEDIGDSPLREAVQDCSEADTEALYRQAIDQLLVLQITGTRKHDAACIAFQQRFDRRLFGWEFEHFVEWGLEKRAGKPLSDADANVLRPLFEDIAGRLDRAPAFLNHRDYHSWNLFVHDGEIRVIDFQDALLGPATYDLATLLNDRDTPTVVTPSLEHKLVEYYYDAWHRAGGDTLSHDSVWHEYNLCLLQKACKVVGRFYYLELEKHKTGYSRYIPPTLDTIRRVLERLPQYRPLQDIVAQHFPQGER
jgi:aminoglycoside/choline kinase family phosphotransferase